MQSFFRKTKKVSERPLGIKKNFSKELKICQGRWFLEQKMMASVYILMIFLYYSFQFEEFR
jgi:hypothetical protein